MNGKKGAGLPGRLPPESQGLYDPRNEHDACGVGFVANTDGRHSHEIVEKGIEVLKNLLHRGATGADRDTGDGAGILFQLPDRFFRRECRARFKTDLPPPDEYGAGMFFLPTHEDARADCCRLFEDTVRAEGLQFIGWRDVPTEPSALGRQALINLPFVRQAFLGGGGLSGDALERKLYVVRKGVEKRVRDSLHDGSFYVPSLSSRTIIYKGLMMATQVQSFYADLRDGEVESALAIVHQRYSTNTFPSWPLAQPFRLLAHNGEINTLCGNRNWMKSRERNLDPGLLGEDLHKVLPILEAGGSDSASLDNVLELLLAGGRSIDHAMMMLIPQAWGAKYPMGPDLRGFFEYHAGIMEPWDGPAAVAFTNGRFVGALLDRNGLRPARYTVTRDHFMVYASEAGVLDLPASRIVEKGALRPGQMLLLDLQNHRLLKDAEIKMHLAHQQPYRRWVEENKIRIHGFFNAIAPVAPSGETILRRQRLFGYTREDVEMILEPMAAAGHEAIGSMGADQPLAVLSEQPQLLYGYFKQVFAQVTNPPIDSIREELVMSLMTFLGTTDKILSEVPQHARLVKLQHPILSDDDIDRIRSLDMKDFLSKTLPIGFAAQGGGHDLGDALEELCRKAEAAVLEGDKFIVLSDRNLPEDQAPIPALLAVAAVNQYLRRKALRTSASLIVETGEAREVMHMCLLLGYGASAINPYLALETVAHRALTHELSVNTTVTQAMENYIDALRHGILKVMSKIGISTLRSYRGAQVFEAIGLNRSVVDRFFEETPSRVEGIGLDGIAIEARARWAQAWRPAEGSALLPIGGRYKYRVNGERHLWTPATISLLQQSTRENDPVLYRRYAELINNQSEKQSTLRGLFRFKPATPVPLREVEPAVEIVKRFVTGAMSYGSISLEAHQTLAIAMNRLSGMSNSGEGGEDRERYKPLPNGDSRNSAIKQIASGRFGVTIEYLVHAKDLQIKISQGAKPGEGGQLPGHKVNAEIAKTRHSTPGVTLISPPPHHDIYSIEDIAQLIYDLKNANPDASISVKLVAEIGVGTVVAGVVKGHADRVLISGYDGGTGASPLSSIQHAGVPWELGLAEAQQTLVLNGLRSRVRLQADGQLKTGRDVAIAALLGAEEFGFATAPLVVCGCVMLRKCHKNTCAVGVATQDPELRKRYTGKPEPVQNFMMMVAEEMREYMAQLGFRTVDEMVGRADTLEMNDCIHFWKARGLDFSKILHMPPAEPGERRCTRKQDHGLEKALDLQLMPKVEAAIDSKQRVLVESPIRNVHRTVGTLISSRIAKKYGIEGLPDDTITLHFTGAAGQSFGAFAAHGLTMILEGEANDYLGKGLSGARLIVKPYPDAGYDPSLNIIAGNVLLYGATSGEAYLNGRVGERFAIRNSGAIAVVEGVGDHGCEYMTGGRIVILGPTGVNFGAGMSGGLAYVYDEERALDGNCNLEMVDLEQVTQPAEITDLRRMIEKHLQYTGSRKAAAVLENWEPSLPCFVKVFPMEYRRVLGQMMREDEETEREVRPHV